MDVLMRGLLQVRRAADAESWETFCRTEAIGHPIGALLWQDPFTAHSFDRPRGYPGDAQLLDYLYGEASLPASTSKVGAGVFAYMMGCRGAYGVRWRRRTLARLIDETADFFPSPRVLSVASGHLREAADSAALRNGRISELIAFDQDADSLAHVSDAYAGTPVRIVNNSVRSILGGRLDLQGFQLVYAAGLYDYLSDRTAAKLTRLMFDMLAPGGRLFVANFLPYLPETGYMETFMDWKLIYRTARQMLALAADIGGEEWTSQRLLHDEQHSIICLELVKRQTVQGRVFVDVADIAIPGLRKVDVSDRTASRTRRKGVNGTPRGANGAPVATPHGPNGVPVPTP